MEKSESKHQRLRQALSAAVLVGALATIPLTVLLEESPTEGWIRVADWIVWSIFPIEYAAMLVISTQRWAYLRRSNLSLAVVVLSFPLLPSLLGLVRLARLARFLRVLRLVGVTARGFVGLRTVLGRRSVLYMATATLLLVCAGGGALTLLEPQTVRGGFLDGVWWAAVTVSTVGYGDIAPTTLWGRAIAVLLMLAGVGLLSTLAASITAYLVGQEASAESAEVRERLARIEGMLSALMAEHEPHSAANAKGGAETPPVPPSRT
jgi:voltage-gated potassium channel